MNSFSPVIAFLLLVFVMLPTRPAAAQDGLTMTVKGKPYHLTWHDGTNIYKDAALTELRQKLETLLSGEAFVADLAVASDWSNNIFAPAESDFIMYKGKRLYLTVDEIKGTDERGKQELETAPEVAKDLYASYFNYVRRQTLPRLSELKETQRVVVTAEGKRLEHFDYDLFILDFEELLSKREPLATFSLGRTTFFHLGRAIELTFEYRDASGKWQAYGDEDQAESRAAFFAFVQKILAKRAPKKNEPPVEQLTGIQDFVHYQGEPVGFRLFYDGREIAAQSKDDDKELYDAVMAYFSARADVPALYAGQDGKLFYKDKEVGLYFTHKVELLHVFPGSPKERSIYYTGLDLEYLRQKLKVHTKALLVDHRNKVLTNLLSALDPGPGLDDGKARRYPAELPLSAASTCRDTYEVLAYPEQIVAVRLKGRPKMEALFWLDEPRLLDCAPAGTLVVARDVTVGTKQSVSASLATNLSDEQKTRLAGSKFTKSEGLVGVFRGWSLTALHSVKGQLAGLTKLRAVPGGKLLAERAGQEVLLAPSQVFAEATRVAADGCDEHYRLYRLGRDLIVYDTKVAVEFGVLRNVDESTALSCSGMELAAWAEAFEPSTAKAGGAMRPALFVLNSGKLAQTLPAPKNLDLSSVKVDWPSATLTARVGELSYAVGLRGGHPDYRWPLGAQCAYQLTSADAVVWSLGFSANGTVHPVAKLAGIRVLNCQGDRLVGFAKTVGNHQAVDGEQLFHVKAAKVVTVRAEHGVPDPDEVSLETADGHTARIFLQTPGLGDEWLELSDDGQVYRKVLHAALAPSCPESRLVKVAGGRVGLVWGNNAPALTMARLDQLICHGKNIVGLGANVAGSDGALSERGIFKLSDGAVAQLWSAPAGITIESIAWSWTTGEITAQTDEATTLKLGDLSSPALFTRKLKAEGCNYQLTSTDHAAWRLRHEPTGRDLGAIAEPGQLLCHGDRLIGFARSFGETKAPTDSVFVYLQDGAVRLTKADHGLDAGKELGLLELLPFPGRLFLVSGDDRTFVTEVSLDGSVFRRVWYQALDKSCRTFRFTQRPAGGLALMADATGRVLAEASGIDSFSCQGERVFAVAQDLVDGQGSSSPGRSIVTMDAEKILFTMAESAKVVFSDVGVDWPSETIRANLPGGTTMTVGLSGESPTYRRPLAESCAYELTSADATVWSLGMPVSGTVQPVTKLAGIRALDCQGDRLIGFAQTVADHEAVSGEQLFHVKGGTLVTVRAEHGVPDPDAITVETIDSLSARIFLQTPGLGDEWLELSDDGQVYRKVLHAALTPSCPESRLVKVAGGRVGLVWGNNAPALTMARLDQLICHGKNIVGLGANVAGTDGALSERGIFKLSDGAVAQLWSAPTGIAIERVAWNSETGEITAQTDEVTTLKLGDLSSPALFTRKLKAEGCNYQLTSADHAAWRLRHEATGRDLGAITKPGQLLCHDDRLIGFAGSLGETEDPTNSVFFYLDGGAVRLTKADHGLDAQKELRLLELPPFPGRLFLASGDDQTFVTELSLDGTVFRNVWHQALVETCQAFRFSRREDGGLAVMADATGRVLAQASTVESFACQGGRLFAVTQGLVDAKGASSPGRSIISTDVEKILFTMSESATVALTDVAVDWPSGTIRANLPGETSMTVGLGGGAINLIRQVGADCGYELRGADFHQWTLELKGSTTGNQPISLSDPSKLSCAGTSLIGFAAGIADKTNAERPLFFYVKDANLRLVSDDPRLNAAASLRVEAVSDFPNRDFIAGFSEGALLEADPLTGRADVIHRASLSKECQSYRILMTEGGRQSLVADDRRAEPLATFDRIDNLRCAGSSLVARVTGLGDAQGASLLAVVDRKVVDQKAEIGGETFGEITVTSDGKHFNVATNSTGVSIAFDIGARELARHIDLPDDCREVRLRQVDAETFELIDRLRQDQVVLTIALSGVPSCHGEHVFLLGELRSVAAAEAEPQDAGDQAAADTPIVGKTGLFIVRQGAIVGHQTAKYGRGIRAFSLNDASGSLVVDLFEPGLEAPTSRLDVATGVDLISGNAHCRGYELVAAAGGTQILFGGEVALHVEGLQRLACVDDRLIALTKGKTSQFAAADEAADLPLEQLEAASSALIVLGGGQIKSFFLPVSGQSFEAIEVVARSLGEQAGPRFRVWTGSRDYTYVLNLEPSTLVPDQFRAELSERPGVIGPAVTRAVVGEDDVAEPASERDRLVKPRYMISLKTRSHVRPGLAVLRGSELFYTSHLGRDGACIGNHIYRVDLRNRREERVADARCVTRLRSDGVRVFVTALGDGESPVDYELKGDELVAITAMPELAAASTARRREHAERRGESAPSELSPALFAVNDLSYAIIARDGRDGSHWFDAYRAGERTPLDGEPRPTTVPSGVVDFVAAGNGRRAFYLIMADGKSQIGVTDVLDPAGKLRVFGGKDPLKPWSSVISDLWSVSRPRYLTALGEGFVIYDDDQALDRSSPVSYYDPGEDRFYRVAVGEKDVGGLSFARDGIVISRPLASEVVWYGSHNPFSEEEVDRTDVRHNPYVPEID